MATQRSLALMLLGVLSPCAVSLTLIGCDDDSGAAPKKASKPAQAKPKVELPKDREILGKRTSEIKDAGKEINSGQAKSVGPRKVVGKDPITLSGNAYVSIIGQAATLNIKHAVDLYHATNGEYPKTHQEFMDGVIRANNIALPKLPVWQEYGYDVNTHSLTLLEYPDRKEQVDAEYDAKAGRTPN